MPTKISIVSPEYKGAAMVPELVRRIKESVTPISEDFEIILVNDASTDNTWTEIQKVCSDDPRVKGINLSRNFGQHYAISAGLQHAKGEWIIVMDCDLQDRPEEIPNLYAKAIEGYDIVYAQRIERKDSFFKKMSSTVFHSIYDWLSGQKTDKTIANFGIYHSNIIAEYNKMPEVARAFGTLIKYLGFRYTSIPVIHDERSQGKSSYSLLKLLKLSSDVIISNSNKPLRLAVGLGISMSIISFLLALYNIFAYAIGIIQVAGFTTTIFSIWFVGGLLLFVMGILGLYIGKIFDQVKGRQLYIIQDKINIEE
jgi:dolichol-phosphate mannosyltransferase